MRLEEVLNLVAAERGEVFLANDPLQFPRRFHAPADREVAAFFSAALAYGRVASILRSLEDLFRRIGPRPADFVGNFDPRRDGVRLEGFRHRFNDGDDLVLLCFLLRRMLEEGGSLEGYFSAGDDSGGEDVGPALASFTRRALAIDVSPLLGRPSIPPGAGVRYFFPSPSGGSACKRLCMFLRWVARPDDGIDLGLWTLSAARLVIPLDTHTARIARLLGLSGRRSADWKMALEVTSALRRLDPADPVRFDFPLAHLGISEGCTGKKGEWCIPCPVSGLCAVRVGRKR